MVIIIKRLVSLLTAAVFILSSFVVADAVRIDGIDSDNEWQSAEKVTYFDNNNGVEAGILSCIIDGFDAYFRLQLVDNDIQSTDTKAGFILCIDGEEILRITLNEQVITGNTDKYYVEAKTDFFNNSGISCEVKVGIKNGIGESLNGTICFTDNDGVRSNVHSFSFRTVEETQPPAPESTTRQTTTARERTTRERTTRQRTTRAQTTKANTTRERTTKERTTKEKTTKARATRKAVTELTTVQIVQPIYRDDVYYTVIPSYVLVNTDAPSEEMTTATAESVTEVNSATRIQYYYADSQGETYNKGKIMKTAVCVAAGIGFLLIALWGAAKIKSDNKNDKEKDNEESDKD